MVSDNYIADDQTLRLTVRADGSFKKHMLSLASLKRQFYVGKVLSQTTSIKVKGKEQLQTTWQVTIGPKRRGELSIPRLRIGKQRTSPITVTVVSSNGSGLKNKPSAVTIQTSIDRPRAYIGEVLTYRVKLLIRTNLSQTTIEPPTGNKVSVSQVNGDSKSEELINGMPVITLTRTYLVTPADTGNIRLTGAVFKGYQVKNGKVAKVQTRRKGKDILMVIKPPARKGTWLPAREFKVKQSWQSDSNGKFKVGEAVTRHIEIRTKGLAQSHLPDLNFSYPSSVRVYNEKPTYESKSGYSIMHFKQVLIPREAGTILLPGMKLKWWNTAKSASSNANIAAKKLVVNPSPDKAVDLIDRPAGTDIDSGWLPEMPAMPQSLSSFFSWQGVALLFAVMWLISTAFWLRTRKRPSPIITPGMQKQEDTLSALYQAALDKDAVKIATLFQLWQKGHLAVPLQKALNTEVDNIQNAEFCENKKGWTNKKLLKLLKKARSHKNIKKMMSSLANITPE
ncbi:BatD family protein [Veronia pacifica]|uniref:BatD family protein n=1 Tax=Veronia pacifica TaxID=1080227 RepID=UPI0009F21EBA|nr:BatD family protein [Veronia pacifica]